MERDNLLIVGAGGHGKVCADIALKMNLWNNISFLDDQSVGKSIMGLSVIDVSNAYANYIGSHDFFVAIGDNHLRYDVYQNLAQAGAKFVSLIHPSAQIGSQVTIGIGSVIMANVVVNPFTTVGRGSILNTSASVDHDNQIGNFVHLSPGVVLSGTVTVEDYTWIGSGSIVINSVKIGPNIAIGAGSLVTRSLTTVGTYYGSPATLRK